MAHQWSQSTCVLCCESSESNFSGVCVPCTDSFCPQTAFVSLKKLDDLTFALNFSNLLLESSSISDDLELSLEDADPDAAFRYRISETLGDYSLKIRFEFFKSFKSKNLKVSFQSPNSKTAKLADQADSPSPFVRSDLSSSSQFDSEIHITEMDILGLELSHQETLEFALNSVFDSAMYTLAAVISSLSLIAIIFSSVALAIASFLPTLTTRVDSLRFWSFHLGHNLAVVSLPVLFNFSLPGNLDSFVTALYKFTFGLDDFVASPISSFFADEPQFFRVAKSNSLIGSIPVLLFFHLIYLFFILLVKFIEKQPQIYGRWKTISTLLSEPFYFIMVFPFVFDLFLNSVLTVRAFFHSTRGLALDFVISLVYLTVIAFGISNQAWFAFSSNPD